MPDHNSEGPPLIRGVGDQYDKDGHPEPGIGGVELCVNIGDDVFGKEDDRRGVEDDLFSLEALELSQNQSSTPICFCH